MEYRNFDEHDLGGIIRLTNAEEWPSLAEDRERALRILAAPGVIAVVAVEGSQVVGFARALHDGELVAYLGEIAVDTGHRGRGIGRRLIEEVFARTKAERMDLLSMPESEGFYRALPNRRWAGYRLYRAGREG